MTTQDRDDGRPRREAPRACAEHDHVVAFYETDAYLVEIAGAFLTDGLQMDGAAVIVAEPHHRDGLRRVMATSGVDLDAAERDNSLVVLDATETLARFMRSTGPDPSRFDDVVGGVLRRAARSGRPLRVYGEMVAVLWADGAVAAAIALEDLWNDLATTLDFTLLCAYPVSAFDDPESSESFVRVCRQHGGVVPSERYGPDADEDGRRRRFAELEREVRVLRKTLGAGTRPAPGNALVPDLPASSDFAAALFAGDAREASRTLREHLAAGVGAETLIVQTLTPAMHEVGRAWENGSLSIGGEHLATVTCQRALTDLYPALLRERPRSRERIVVAGVQGERHAIAPRIIGDLLEGAGYDVVHLGADVPASTIVEAARRVDAPLVALSLTIAQNAPSLAATIATVQAELPGIPILLGGQGTGTFAEQGFPVADSARDAVTLVAELIAERPRMPSPTAYPSTARPLPSARLDDATGRYAEAADDLGELARAHALRAHEYRYQAMQDPVTGLPNRRAYDDRLVRMGEAGVHGAALIIDVDEFKLVNDTLGHEGGDEVLRRVGQTLAAAVRPGDLVARLGGDEFGVLLARGPEPVRAADVAERLRAAVQMLCADIGVTISVGGAAFDGDRRRTSLAADRALYEAKHQGRNAAVITTST